MNQYDLIYVISDNLYSSIYDSIDQNYDIKTIIKPLANNCLISYISFHSLKNDIIVWTMTS